jgi:type VI secretion system secreted protein VgrG
MSGTITSFTQTGRFLTIDCPLAATDLLLTDVQGTEKVSEPFSYQATISTIATDDAVRGLLGKNATLWLRPDASISDPRPIHGVIRHISGPDRQARGVSAWQLVVVPKLALLSLTSDCKIFQDMKVSDIIKSVLDAHGVTYRLSVTADYPALDYCVQYRETALNFVSRLMEQVGMFYWHEHTGTTHTMVIVDSNLTAKAALAGDAKTEQDSSDPDVTDMHENYAFRSGKWSLTDYDFTVPTTDLLGTTPTTETTAGLTDYEMFDYPGPFALSGDSLKKDGSKVTRLRIENEEANFHRVTGTGRRVSLTAGSFLKFGTGQFTPADQKLFIIEVTLTATHPAPLAGSTATPEFNAHFSTLPFSKAFRPDRLAVKPFVRGLQTAVVTGPAGEKIYTDKHGRVKVKFFWDRVGQKDDKSSCWIRVSQVWADKNYGALHIPRIGQEVIVDFLEGDPDRPIITGRVYNGDNMSPYALPANKTQSGFKSYSVPGSGFNEFRFEDKGGSEQIYMQAQKNLDVDVLNNETRDVGVNRTTTVGGIDKRTVTGATQDILNSNYTRTVATGVTDTIAAGGETRTITGGITETVTGDVAQTVVGNITNTVTASISLTAPVGINLTSATAVTITQPTQFSTGATCLSAYGFNFGAYGANTQVAGFNGQVFGAQVTAAGLNFQLNGITSTISGVQQDVQGITLKEFGTKLETVATTIKLTAMLLVM